MRSSWSSRELSMGSAICKEKGMILIAKTVMIMSSMDMMLMKKKVGVIK